MEKNIYVKNGVNGVKTVAIFLYLFQDNIAHWRGNTSTHGPHQPLRHPITHSGPGHTRVPVTSADNNKVIVDTMGDTAQVATPYTQVVAGKRASVFVIYTPFICIYLISNLIFPLVRFIYCMIFFNSYSMLN